MSDQSPPPPKPKPGSLRDRIAAFEKSASATPPPAAPPAVRPKPAGFSSWKPKAPSPPSSPSAASTEHATSSVTKPGGMSASDAKESITKGGSLKDRMAALQGKGAFGAPPSVAPKPALEKPKWKPPPVVQAPIDDDDHSGGGPTAGAVERTVSPPVSVKSPESVDAPKVVEEGGEPAIPATVAEGDNEGEPAALDPEEEERQRRAAIAARMARLGGARLGMAPPVFGKKPPVRRPTQEDVPKTEEPKVAAEPPKRDVSTPEVVKSTEEQLSPPTEPIIVTSPQIEVPAQIQAEHDVGQSPEYFPVRRDSENASILSSESADSHPSRSPSSMPIPVVPRRSGPPRKKPVKPAAPPPEVLEEKAEESAPAPVVLEETEQTPTPEAGQAAPAQPDVASPENEEAKPEITEEVTQPPASEPSLAADHEVTPELIPETETPVADMEETESIPTSSEVEPSSVSEETPGIGSPPTPASGLAYDVESDYEDEPEAADISRSPPVSVPSPPLNTSHLNVANLETGIIEPNSTPVAGVLQDESDAAEEEARKKRVADRIAKMGGINPFAPPPQAKPSPESAHSPPPVPAAFVPSPPLAPVPVRQPSLHPEPHSPSLEDVQTEQKENLVESTAEEEAFDEVEDYVDEVNDEPTPASTSEVDKPVTPTLPHSESYRESAAFASRPPPPPHLGTRPPVQVQQHDEEDDDGSDYGDDDSAEDIPPTSPVRPPSPPGRPSTLSTTPSEHINKPPSPPARPAQPHRRIIPQAPEPTENDDEEGEEEEEETDEEADERLATSQLFVPPPSGRGPIAIPRHVQAEAEEEGDGSENDAPALPVLHRRSLEVLPGRSVPPPPPPVHPPALDEDSEPESDHDGQALPVPPPPRHTGGPPPRSVPPPPPPPQVQAERATAAHLPPPPAVRRTLPPAPRLNTDHPPTSPEHLTPTVSISESDEILDEEEGDPIDPSFHSPSRRASAVNLFSTAQAQAQSPTQQEAADTIHAPPPPPPVAQTSREPSEQAEEPEQDSEQLRRRTIAERMAKLGGIRFGGAPMPIPASRPIPPPRPDDQQEAEEKDSELAAEEQSDALSEEEEERARKERISAKLAGMGGMRIGMMPMGIGSFPPQRSHVLREENVVRSPPPPAPAPTQPARAMPPARPPPPPAPVQPPQGPDTDSDYGSAEDGVKVEAEESEMEEVGYEDAVEEHEEAPPPPVPSRGGRAPPRRESSDKSMSPPMPPIPSPRPPVPSAIPNRRSSVQTSRSTSSTTDTGTSQPQRKTTSSYMPQSEYVMVEEPEGQEASPPPPPARPVSRVPPMRSTPQVPQTSDTQDSISSQWELPSIPTSSFDFGGGADLSLSWTEAAAEPVLPTSPPPPPPPSKKPSLPPAGERQLSADDLIGLWGRVGVQVCESATTLFEKSKRTLIGDGTYEGFVQSVLAAVPNAASVPTESGGYGYLIYVQNGPSVQKRVSEIMPGDIVEIHDGKLKGHKGIQTYHQNVGGAGEVLVGIVGEFEAKKSKIRVFQANQHVGQQTVESVSYRLEDLKSGIVKVYRVLDA